MSSLTAPLSLFNADVFTTSATQQHELGVMGQTQDGRKFRYVKAGGVTLVPGKLQQSSAEVTANENLAVAAAAIGATTVTTTSTVTLTANQLAGGFVIVTVTPGQGYQYRIKSHPAATSAVVTLTLEDPILVALSTASKIDLVPSPYSGVIVNPSVATGNVLGVAVYPITNAQFGWIQTGGLATILVDDQTVVVGTTLSASNQAAGAVEPFTGVQAAVGIAMTGIATTEYGAVYLTID